MAAAWSGSCFGLFLLGVGGLSSDGGSVEGSGTEGSELLPLVLLSPIPRLNRFFCATPQEAVIDWLSVDALPFITSWLWEILSLKSSGNKCSPKCHVIPILTRQISLISSNTSVDLPLLPIRPSLPPQNTPVLITTTPVFEKMVSQGQGGDGEEDETIIMAPLLVEKLQVTSLLTYGYATLSLR